jgi:hypothetical protein
VFTPLLAMLRNEHPDDRRASDLVHHANHSGSKVAHDQEFPLATNPTTTLPEFMHRVDSEVGSQLTGLNN